MNLPSHLRSLPAGQELLGRSEREERRRGPMVEIATEVFAERGYPATTIDDIVNAAGSGVGRFYGLFESKEDCFGHCQARALAEGREAVIAAAGEESDWGRRLVAGLRALCEAIVADPAAARVALVEAPTAGPGALAAYEGMLEQVAGFLAGARALAGKPEPSASLDPAVAGGLAWYLQQRLIKDEAKSARKLLPEAIEVAAEPYLGKKATARLLAAARSAP